jgi:hypothetical protein
MEVIVRRKLHGSRQDFVILKCLILAQNKRYELKGLEGKIT